MTEELISFRSLVKSRLYLKPDFSDFLLGGCAPSLKEIKPNWMHPVTNEHINTLIDKLSQNEKNSILKVEKY